MLAEANSLIRSAPAALAACTALRSWRGGAVGRGRAFEFDPLAEVQIGGFADALYGREAVLDGRACVHESRLDAVLRGLAAIVEPSVLAKVPEDVDVGVDEARQEGVLR